MADGGLGCGSLPYMGNVRARDVKKCSNWHLGHLPPALASTGSLFFWGSLMDTHISLFLPKSHIYPTHLLLRLPAPDNCIFLLGPFRAVPFLLQDLSDFLF